jgi:hypothetical protein
MLKPLPKFHPFVAVFAVIDMFNARVFGVEIQPLAHATAGIGGWDTTQA